MKKITRRQMLKISLGAGQLALLSGLGYNILGSKQAFAASADAPTRLLTLYVPGGWMPTYMFCPLSPAEISSYLPPAEVGKILGSEPTFFNANHVTNLDGSGEAPGPDGFPRLRVAKLWDDADPGRNRDGYSPHGYAWQHYELWKNASIVHGVDQGTATHESGKVSAMCGVAGSSYRAPGVHAVVANALYDRFQDQRPLPAVAIGNGPVPPPMHLPAHAAPTSIASMDTLAYTLAEAEDNAWAGLRDRSAKPGVDFHGQPLAQPVDTNAMDERTLERLRTLAGRTNDGTDAFYESMYELYRNVGTQLARDVVDTIQNTPGWEHSPRPHWINLGGDSPYAVDLGRGNESDSGGTWAGEFELALKLLKSNLTSAISIRADGVKGFYFDTHGGNGERTHFVKIRATLDIIGRLLGEMKATPLGNGRTLLDDTLVLVVSEFSRTWSNNPAAGSDHWPITSAIIAGGGVVPNRMIGDYDFSNGGPMGAELPVVEEGGDPNVRVPRSGDIIHTALHMMGIEHFFIPGGSAFIEGVRA